MLHLEKHNIVVISSKPFSCSAMFIPGVWFDVFDRLCCEYALACDVVAVHVVKHVADLCEC